jgi:hypothetical protein
MLSRWGIALLMFLSVGLAFAQTPVTVTGVVQDTTGVLATSGTVTFTLQPQNSGVIYFVAGTGIIAPQTGTCGIDLTGNIKNLALSGACTVWGTDVLQPGNLTYQVAFFPNGVTAPTNVISQQCITGSSYSLNSPKFCPVIKPTPQGAVVITSPIQNNLIPAVDAVFNLGSASLRYGNIFAANGTFTNSIVAPNVPAGTVNTGTGTTNTIPKFTNGATGVLGNSSVTDNGTTVSTSEIFSAGSYANNLGAFATTTSAQLRGVISDETGTGAAVFATSPVLTTPALGAATATSIAVSGAVKSCGGTPWFDVTCTNFAGGAKCDAVTDDTAAIQAAWNAAKAVGSGAFVFFPPEALDCIAAGTLNFSSTNSVRFGGLGGGTVTLASPRIVFTGTTGPLVNCQNSLALTFQNIAFNYNNASFVDNVFDCTSAGISSNIRWENVEIGGFSTAKSAANLILAPGCHKCGVYNSHFGWSINGVNSLTGNVFTIEDSDFGTAGNVISGTYIVNTTAGSRITGNNFEFINAPNTASIFDSSAGGCFGCEFSGNWSGDMPAGWAGTLLKGATGGMSIHGNTFQGVATGTILTINGGQNGLDFTGNSVQGPWGTIFTANNAVSNVNITGNQYSGAITNFWTGAGNIPSSGIVTDNSGNTTIYGGNVTHSAATFPLLMLNAQGGAVDSKNYQILGTSTQLIFRHINDALGSISNGIVLDNVANVMSDVQVVPPLDFLEQGAPTARASNDRCYGDSTSHTLKCSYNSGSFFNVGQVIASGTAVMPVTAFGAAGCNAAVTVAATGVLTTDTIEWAFNVDPGATTGYSTGVLHIYPYPTAGNVNFRQCSSGVITPGTATLNWRVVR